MGQDGTLDPLWVPAPLQFLTPAKRVICRCRVSLIVEIVQQADDTPVSFVGSEMPGVATQRGFDRKRVLAQAVARGPFRQQRPRLVVVQGHSAPFAARGASPEASGAPGRTDRGAACSSSNARVITAVVFPAR